MRTAAFLGHSSSSLPADSYIYTVLPINGNLSAISSDDSLRVLDQTTLQLVPNGVFDNVHSGVTCLKSLDAEWNTLLTAGRDAKIRSWDLRAGTKTVELKHGSGSPYLSLAASHQGTMIAAGTELKHAQAAVVIWDYRSPIAPLSQYVESHNDDVTDTNPPWLQFHSTRPSCLLSGSTDGLVNIYDTAISDEDDAIVQITNHGSSIGHTGFLSNSEFFALSHDEIFSVYPLNESDERDDQAPTVFGDVRPILDCEYVVDVISAPGEVIIGAGTHSKHHLDLISLRSSPQWSFDLPNKICLPNAHGEDIVRSVCFSQESSTLFTAGEDGLVKAWRSPQVESDLNQRLDDPPKKKKRRKESSAKEGRFKPY